MRSIMRNCLYASPMCFSREMRVMAIALMVILGCGSLRAEPVPSADQVTAELYRRSHDEASPPRALTPNEDYLRSLTNKDLKELASQMSADLERRAIYDGTDKRKDWYQLDSLPGGKDIIDAAQSSVAIFTADSVRETTDQTGLKTFELITQDLNTKCNLCADEKINFRTQQAGAVCSGALISNNQVLTAGHCVHEVAKVKGPFLKDLYFVFGFRTYSPDDAGRTLLGKDQVYRAKGVVGAFDKSPNLPYKLVNADIDWAIVTLDGTVNEAVAKPVSAVRSEKMAQGEPVYTIGYPSGLPLKYAGGAKVINNTPGTFFLADLDTFAGNSGSPVYDSKNQLAGILVRGATDYISRDGRTGECSGFSGCCIPNICPGFCGVGEGNDRMEGEGVTRISVVQFEKIQR